MASKASPAEIPDDFLRTPFIKDVTQEYVPTQNYASGIQPGTNHPEPKWGFAAVFNYSKWKIIDWGTCTGISFIDSTALKVCHI